MHTCRPRPSCACPRSRARRLSRRPCTARSPPHRDAGVGTLSDCAICPSAGRPFGPCDGAGRGREKGKRGVRVVVPQCGRSGAAARLRGTSARSPGAHSPRVKNVAAKSSPRASVARDSRISSYPRSGAFESARVGGVKGRRETRGVRARRRGARARVRPVTHLSTLKSTSCRIFSQAPMPCFCTASRSACSSVASQYPLKAICGALPPGLGFALDFIVPSALRAADPARSVRCGPSATTLESERTRPTLSPRRELLPRAARAELTERASRGRANAKRKRPEFFDRLRPQCSFGRAASHRLKRSSTPAVSMFLGQFSRLESQSRLRLVSRGEPHAALRSHRRYNFRGEGFLPAFS